MSKLWKLNLFLLVLLVISVWFAVINYPEPRLKVIACDVGQGDAILITYKSDQILIDGGPNNEILNCLSSNMPFWDRTIEVVILTHPQKDHYYGLIEVFERYNVFKLVATGLDSSSQEYQVLKNTIGGSGAEVVNPTTGMFMRLGLIYLDILNPSMTYIADNSDIYTGSKNVLGVYTSSKDPNLFSVVVLLDYKNFEALFTGDIDPVTSDIVADELRNYDGVEDGIVEYLKVPHHGSKNGLSEKLLKQVHPIVSVIPAGKNNRYGHPHKEILDMLKASGTNIESTAESGDVIVESDGESVWLR